MNGLGAAISVELLKARRSRVPWAIAAGFSLFPIVGGFFMLILKDPERARQLGLLGAKAELAAGTADWPTFVGLVSQAVAIGGAANEFNLGIDRRGYVCPGIRLHRREDRNRGAKLIPGGPNRGHSQAHHGG